MTLTPEAALVIVEQLAPNGKLIHIQAVVFLGAWEGWSYDRIAKESGYNQGHVKNTGGQLWSFLSNIFGEKVTKANLPGAFRRYIDRDRSTAVRAVGENSHIDWGEAIDASIFYGRTAELKSLTSWVQTQQCRLVAICGMAGIGKTALAVKLTEAVAADFDRVIWIGLRDTPPITELLDDIIQRLSPADRPMTVVENVAAEIGNLMKILSRGRYLIVLDNFDAVFSSDMMAEPIDPSRVARPNYYLELLKSAGELRHQSCVLVTTREKPSAIAALAGEALPVRTLALPGLGQAAAGELLRAKGLTADRSCDRLVKNYGGHPLALKVVAATIQDLFDGDIDLFIGAGVSGFRELDRFLVPQFDRLTELEEQILYWLAIDRTSISLDELQSAIGQRETRWEIQTALLSLHRRSLVERHPQGFGLHPVVMEFVTARFLDRLSREIVSGECDLLLNYPLMKATAAEYVRERQIRMILTPLCERLFKQLSDMQRVRSQILSLFDRLRERDLHRQGYGIGNCLNLCRHLQIDLTGIDLAEASIRQAYLADVQLHNVNCRAADFQDCRIAQTFGGMTCVTFSPNGELLATCDANGEIQLWQVADSRRLLTLRGHDYWLWSVEFSPDGRQLVTGGQDRTARLWDIQTGDCRYTISESSVVNHVTFSPNGELLATSCEDGLVKLWNAKTGELVQTLSGHERRTWSAAFFPDGNSIVSGSEDGTVKIWDVATGICRQTWHGHQHWIWKVAVSPDGRTIASTSFDLTTRLWDVETATCRLILTGHRDFIIAAAFSPDGNSIATGSYDKTIKIWDVATGACQQTWEKHTSRIWSVAFHPQGAMLASGADDYTVRLWNTQTGRCTQLLQGYSNQIFSVAIDRSGRSIASGHEDQTICLWRIDADGQPPILDRKLTGHSNRVLSVAFDPNKQRLASSSCDRTIQLWDLGSGHCTHTLHGHQSWVWSVAFAPNGRLLASGSYDHAVRVWDPTTGVCLHTLTRAGTGAVQQVSFSPDGRWLASCGYPHTINLWDGETASYCHELVGHKARVWSMGWIGSDRLATGSEDGMICLWSVADGVCLRTWTAHNCQVFCLEYDPTTDRLFSSDAKGKLKIWDLTTGNPIATIDAHDHWLFSFCFTPDRRHLYTSSLDGKLKLWDLVTQDCLVELIPPRPYEGMQIAGITGLNDAEYSTLIALGANAVPPQHLS